MAVDLLNLGLSLFGGAGGAVLLEMWWNPRYAKKRAAVLLLAEIRKNRDLLEDRAPRLSGIAIFRDLMLPTIALDATVADLGHFPVQLAQEIICLYHDYAKILRAYDLQVEAFNDTVGVGPPAEEKTRNFEVTRTVLLQLMTRGLNASDKVIPALEAEAAKSMLPGRRPRLLPEAPR
jgi:hypothetical protein